MCHIFKKYNDGGRIRMVGLLSSWWGGDIESVTMILLAETVETVGDKDWLRCHCECGDWCLYSCQLNVWRIDEDFNLLDILKKLAHCQQWFLPQFLCRQTGEGTFQISNDFSFFWSRPLDPTPKGVKLPIEWHHSFCAHFFETLPYTLFISYKFENVVWRS